VWVVEVMVVSGKVRERKGGSRSVGNNQHFHINTEEERKERVKVD
jgi:hypothetical protein